MLEKTYLRITIPLLSSKGLGREMTEIKVTKLRKGCLQHVCGGIFETSFICVCFLCFKVNNNDKIVHWDIGRSIFRINNETYMASVVSP